MNILDLHELEKNNNAVTVTIGQIGSEVLNMHVKKYLTIGEFASFVHDMQEAEFSEEDNDYAPEVGLITYKLALVRMYTDLELPEDVELAYQIINEFNLDTKILAVLQDSEQYTDLLEVIERAINYKRDSMIGVNKLYNTIIDAVNSVPWKKLGNYAEEYFDPKNMNQLVDLLVENVGNGKLDSFIKALM